MGKNKKHVAGQSTNPIYKKINKNSAVVKSKAKPVKLNLKSLSLKNKKNVEDINSQLVNILSNKNTQLTKQKKLKIVTMNERKPPQKRLQPEKMNIDDAVAAFESCNVTCSNT